MDIKSKKFWIFALITFVIVFLMNYLGNNSVYKISQSLMNASAGVVGLTIGMWLVNKFKNDKNPPQEFD